MCIFEKKNGRLLFGLLSINICMQMALRDGQNERKLLDRVRNGDNEAVARLYKTYYPAVYHYIVRNNGNEDDAVEVYQQTIIILYEKLQEPAFVLQSQLGTFIYAVARNLWLATLKDRRRFRGQECEEERMVIGADEESQVEEIVQREREFGVMERCLDELGEPCRTLLRCFYHDEMSMDQIAREMGYTNAENAKNQKYKCLQRLRRLFTKDSRLKTDQEKVEG